MEKEKLNILSKEILGASIAVHKEMGPGLLESVYQQCLVRELSLRELMINTMVPISLTYKGYPLIKIMLLIFWLKMKLF